MDVTLIKLSELRKLSQEHPGLLDAFLQRGEIRGDSVAIERKAFEEINASFFGTGPQLGTIVHKVVAPIARAIDAVAGTKLQNCGACAQREMRLNAATATKP